MFDAVTICAENIALFYLLEYRFDTVTQSTHIGYRHFLVFWVYVVKVKASPVRHTAYFAARASLYVPDRVPDLILPDYLPLTLASPSSLPAILLSVDDIGYLELYSFFVYTADSARHLDMVREVGFEPTTFRLQTGSSGHAELHPEN